MKEKQPINPTGECECGCGQITPLVSKTITQRGYKKGDHLRFIPEHHSRRYNEFSNTKLCRKCKKEKDREIDFAKHSKNFDGKSSWCKECVKEYKKIWEENGGKEKHRKSSKAWAKNNPEKRKEIIKRYSLKKKYNLSLDEYNELLNDQENKCMICKSSNAECVDHIHRKNKNFSKEDIRGILCNNCNLGLGNFRDNPKLLIAAIEYLNNNGYEIH